MLLEETDDRSHRVFWVEVEDIADDWIARRLGDRYERLRNWFTHLLESGTRRNSCCEIGFTSWFEEIGMSDR